MSDKLKVADAAQLVLASEQRPVHIDQLVIEMAKVGWVCGGKSPRQVAYASLHDFIKRRGTDSQIILLGACMFSLREFAQNEGERPVRSDAKDRAPRKFVQALPVAQQFCGNCASMEYTGSNVAHLARGTCSQYTASGRICNRSDAPSCPLWTLRSKTIMFSEQRKKKDCQEIVATLNRSINMRRAIK